MSHRWERPQTPRQPALIVIAGGRRVTPRRGVREGRDRLKVAAYGGGVLFCAGVWGLLGVAIGATGVLALLVFLASTLGLVLAWPRRTRR